MKTTMIIKFLRSLIGKSDGHKCSCGLVFKSKSGVKKHIQKESKIIKKGSVIKFRRFGELHV